MNGEIGLCGVCQEAARQACGGCGAMFYCGKDHQRKHWPTHRTECQPYRLVSSPEAGQYLVAGRNLKSGQSLIKDTPLVVAPLACSPLVCLGCTASIETDDFVKCPQCHWPLCSPECATSSQHKDECHILSRDVRKIGAPSELEQTSRYDIIMTLRCLMLSSSNPAGWKTLLGSASHVKQRMLALGQYQKTTVSYLKQGLKVEYDTDTINHVHSVVATNAIEIRSDKGTTMRAIYPRIRLLNHSCVPNVHLTCFSEGVMEVKTAVDIDSGDPLHICYTGTVMPYWERQKSLNNSYYFTCACSRCDDPTEVGTHFSSPKCPECKDNYLESSKKEEEILWECSKCMHQQNNETVQENVNTWLSRLQTEEIFKGGSPSHVLSVLQEAEKSFHPSHYVWMKVAQSSLWIMRNNSPTQETLNLRKDLWTRLLALYDTFEPGLTRRRGMSLLETGKALYDASMCEYKIDAASCCASQVQTAAKYFQEAAHILSMEPPESMEASLAKRAEVSKVLAEDLLTRMGSGSLRAE